MVVKFNPLTLVLTLKVLSSFTDKHEQIELENTIG